MRKNTVSKQAMTLIEIVIALLVFGVGVLVSLRAIVFFVGSGDEVAKRAQATLLAKEAIDIIYNQRDSNLRKGVKWNCASVVMNEADDDMCELDFAIGKAYIVGFDGVDGSKIVETKLPSEGELITDDTKLTLFNLGDKASYYAHSSLLASNANVQPAEKDRNLFHRVVTFQEVENGEETLDPTKVLKVTVQIPYLAGKPERVVVLESFLAAGERTE